MTHPTEVSEVSAAEVEVLLLREVFQAARAFLRFNGVDLARANRAMGELDMACEQVKLFDGNMLDEDDQLKLLFGGTSHSVPRLIIEAYETGYTHGLRLDGCDNADHSRYKDCRQNEAFCEGYRRGARLAVRQSSFTPQAIDREIEASEASLRRQNSPAIPGLEVTESHHDQELDITLRLDEALVTALTPVAAENQLTLEQLVATMIRSAKLSDIMAAALRVQASTPKPRRSGGDHASAAV